MTRSGRKAGRGATRSYINSAWEVRCDCVAAGKRQMQRRGFEGRPGGGAVFDVSASLQRVFWKGWSRYCGPDCLDDWAA
jgi:hypothetical protein